MAEVTLQLMGPSKSRAFVTGMCSRLRLGKLLHEKCALTRAMKYLPETQVSDETGDLLVLGIPHSSLDIPHWPKKGHRARDFLENKFKVVPTQIIEQGKGQDGFKSFPTKSRTSPTWASPLCSPQHSLASHGFLPVVFPGWKQLGLECKAGTVGVMWV